MTFPNERELLANIRNVFEEFDPVPPEVMQAAKGALVWRTSGADLAELTADSRADSGPAGGGSPRLVGFEAEALAVEVEIAEAGEARRLIGQLVPPSAAQVTVRSTGGEQTIEADELGRFVAEKVPPGPVSLLCRLAAAPYRGVVTAWISI
jgi:hypothetical protein